jgi:hypothetical protein
MNELKLLQCKIGQRLKDSGEFSYSGGENDIHNHFIYLIFWTRKTVLSTTHLRHIEAFISHFIVKIISQGFIIDQIDNSTNYTKATSKEI